jgi:hypothetical protein
MFKQMSEIIQFSRNNIEKLERVYRADQAFVYYGKDLTKGWQY